MNFVSSRSFYVLALACGLWACGGTQAASTHPSSSGSGSTGTNAHIGSGSTGVSGSSASTTSSSTTSTTGASSTTSSTSSSSTTTTASSTTSSSTTGSLTTGATTSGLTTGTTSSSTTTASSTTSTSGTTSATTGGGSSGSTGTDPCTACEDQASQSGGACSSQYNTCASSQDCVNFANCVGPCQDQTCVTNCENQYPNGVQPLSDYLNCLNTACSSQCGSTGGSSGGSTGSTTGGAGSICSSCTQASDCQSGYCTIYDQQGDGFCDSTNYCQSNSDCNNVVACDTSIGSCSCPQISGGGSSGSTGGSTSGGHGSTAICGSCSTNSDCASGFCNLTDGSSPYCDSYYICQSSADCGGTINCSTINTNDCACPQLGGGSTGSTTGGTTTGSSTTSSSSTTGTTGSCTTETWSNFGKAFFQNNCTRCHYSGGQYPNLSSHSTVQSDASTIQYYIDTGRMPPDATLSSSDISAIDQYLSCGAP